MLFVVRAEGALVIIVVSLAYTAYQCGSLIVLQMTAGFTPAKYYAVLTIPMNIFLSLPLFKSRCQSSYA